MAEPEAVEVVFVCGSGMCDLDVSPGDEKQQTRVVIGGAEGLIKVLDPSRLDEPVMDMDLDEKQTGDDYFAATAVAVSPAGDELAVGLRNGDVKLFDFPALEFKAYLTRFSAAVLSLDYGMKDGGVIAASSEEPGIRIVRRSNNSSLLVLDDHEGGTKSVKWDPKGEFLAAAGFDGTVKVWKVDPSLDSLVTDVVHTGDYFEKEAPGGSSGPDSFVHLGKVAWHPDGKSLCMTGGTEPLLLTRDTWRRSMIVPEDAEQGGHAKEITAAAFSPDGRHLATAALDGRVVLWSVEGERAEKTFVSSDQDNWRHLQWLDASSLAALSMGGHVGIIKHNTAPSAPSATEEMVKGRVRDKNSRDDPDANQRSSSTAPNKLFDEEAAEDDGNHSEAETAARDDAAGNEHVAAGDVTAGLDDSGLLSAAHDGASGSGTREGGEDAAAANGVQEGVPSMSGVVIPQEIATPLQDPFQPSSTPLGDARRYLCWNRVGTIISIDENTHNAVEIEFADKSAGRNQRFMDTWNFVMGSLSSTGAIFASVGQDEDENSYQPSPSGGRSVLYYKALGRRSSAGQEWTRMMPRGENILGVAVGKGWAAAATDRQFVRLFSGSGLQGETVMLPGPIVSMVGGGDLLAVVFHKGNPVGDSQNLGYHLLDVGGKRELAEGALCMTPGAELMWLGMSEELMLVAMDSSGLILSLTPSFGWRWTPLLDTLSVSKNKRDRFWPVGIVTGRLLAATLKGGEEHPAAYPRPVLTSVPFTALSTKSQDGEEMSKFEKTYPAIAARVRQRAFNLEAGLTTDDAEVQELETELTTQQAQLDAMVVKRLQEACNCEKAGLALDLASLLHLEKSFDIAIKVANHHGLIALAENIEAAMITKFRDNDAQEEEMDGHMDNEQAWSGATFRQGVEENLGPLDRARLEAKRERSSRHSIAPPQRTAAAAAAGDRYESDDENGDVGATSSVRGGDDTSEPEGEGGEVLDNNEHSIVASPGRRDRSTAGKVAEDDAEEALAPPAPKNPFARGGGNTFSSPPKKKRKDILETMNDLKASPSPLTKRPALSRLSSFATEARTKNRNDRNVL